MAVNPKFIQALKDGAPHAALVTIDHPAGMARFWSGIGELDYEGHVYKGAGLLGSVQSAKKAVELRVDEVTLSLSGIDAEVLEKLSGDIRNREAVTTLAALTPDYRVAATMLIDTILLDYMHEAVADDGTVTVSVVGEAGFWQLQRVTDEVWSDANQQLKYPGDTGFSLIASMRAKQTNWLRVPV